MLVTAGNIRKKLEEEGFYNINEGDIEQVIFTLFPECVVKKTIFNLTDEELTMIINILLKDKFGGKI